MKCDSNRLLQFLQAEIIAKDSYRLQGCGIPDWILDIGANCGVFSMHARSMFPGVPIDAFEPCGATYAMLVENTTGHDISTHNVALGDGAPVRIRGARNSGSNQTQSAPEGTPSRGLRGLLELTGRQITPRTFIKIDCEGAERYLMDDDSIDLLKGAGHLGMEYHLNTPFSPTRTRFPLGPLPAAFDAWVAKFNGALVITRKLSCSDRGMVWGTR